MAVLERALDEILSVGLLLGEFIPVSVFLLGIEVLDAFFDGGVDFFGGGGADGVREEKPGGEKHGEPDTVQSGGILHDGIIRSCLGHDKKAWNCDDGERARFVPCGALAYRLAAKRRMLWRRILYRY